MIPYRTLYAYKETGGFCSSYCATIFLAHVTYKVFIIRNWILFQLSKLGENNSVGNIYTQGKYTASGVATTNPPPIIAVLFCYINNYRSSHLPWGWHLRLNDRFFDGLIEFYIFKKAGQIKLSPVARPGQACIC